MSIAQILEKHSGKKKTKHTGWAKLGMLAPDFEWRGISAEEFLRKPQPEPSESQTPADLVASDSYAVFRCFDELRRDLNVVRWLPVFLDSTGNHFIFINGKYTSLVKVPEQFGRFQRFERIPVKRLYETSTGRMIPVNEI